MLEKYFDAFSDTSINSWEKIGACEFKSPIKTQIIDIRNIDWDEIQQFSHSEILWHYSLGAITKCFLTSADIDISSCLDSFSKFQISENNKYLYDIKFNHSYDHCMAVRVRYLCILLSKGYENPNNIVNTIIQFDLNWFLLQDNLPQNNHGMMVCIAVLHACLFVDLSNDNKKVLIDKATNFFIEILSSVIPSNYYIYENTIGYHEFYVKSLKNTLSFLEEYNISTELKIYLQSIIENLESTLFKLVFPNGGLPPIGQCGSYNTNYPSTTGKFLFNPQGFWVNKNHTNYLSFTCGFASTIHKQIDDTSILLRIDHEDIFLDCGLGTYDHRDFKAKVINGQRGHSGAFFKKFDTWTMWDFFSSKKIENIEMSLVENNNSLIGTKSFSYNHDTYLIRRKLTYDNFSNIHIMDMFSTNNIFASPVSRFILPKYVEIEKNDNEIIITYHKNIIKMIIPSAFNLNLSPSLEYHNDDFSSAYASTAYGIYNEVITLEITPIGISVLDIHISIEPNNV